MSLELEWSGQESFVAEPLRDWTVDGKVAGKVRSSGPFTFATIAAAGHMVRGQSLPPETLLILSPWQVPYDKPKESLELVKRWLAGEEL